jgi:hypothetical protein
MPATAATSSETSMGLLYPERDTDRVAELTPAD